MRVLRFVLSLACAAVLVGAVSAERKKAPTNKDKIVGSWELVKAATTEKTVVLPTTGAVFEFTKDGKIKVFGKMGDKLVDGGEGKSERSSRCAGQAV